MKNLLFLFLSLSVLSSIGSQSASANCGITLSASSVTINWDIGFSTKAIQFTLQKTNVPACNYWIGFSKGSAASAASRRLTFGAAVLPYQLYKDNTLTKVLMDSIDGPIISEDNVIKGGFSEGANLTQTLLYFLNIPSSGSISPTLARNGTYTDTFTMFLYEGSDPTIPNPVAVGSSTILATVTVPSIIKMSLVSPGAPFDESATSRSIDFGSLSPGLSGQFDLRLYTNAGFTVTFSSENNGSLKSPNNSTGVGVPYSFYVNGDILNLTNSAQSPVIGLSGSGQTTLEGLGYPIRVRIGNFSTLIRGGIVRDVITMTATTTE